MSTTRRATRGSRASERHVFHPLTNTQRAGGWISTCGMEVKAKALVDRQAGQIVSWGNNSTTIVDCPACFADEPADAPGIPPRPAPAEPLPEDDDAPMCAECGEPDPNADGSCCGEQDDAQERTQPIDQTTPQADNPDAKPQDAPAPPRADDPAAPALSTADLRRGCTKEAKAEGYTERLRGLAKTREVHRPAEIQPTPCPGCAEDAVVLVRFETRELCPRCKRRLAAGQAIPEPHPCPGCSDELADEDLVDCAEADLCIGHTERRRDHLRNRDTAWMFHWRPADSVSPCFAISTIGAPSEKEAEAFLRDDLAQGQPILIKKRRAVHA